MKNLLLLIKNNFNILIGSFQGKKRRKSVLTAFILFMCLTAGLIALFCLQAWAMTKSFVDSGNQTLALFHALLLSVSFLFLVSAMRVSSKQKHNDSDFLSALPLNKRDIVLSKVLNKYAFDFFFIFIMLLPFVIFYLILVGFNWWVLISGILLLFLLPLLSVGIGYVYEFIITRLFNKCKRAELLKSVVTSIIFIVVVLLLYIKTFNYDAGFVGEDFYTSRPFSYLLLNFMLNPTFFRVAGVLLICFAFFVFGCVLYYHNYGKTFYAYKNTDNTLKFKSNSLFSCLLQKEFTSYFGNSTYVVNTLIGPIIMLIIVVALCFVRIETLFGLDGLVLPNEIFVAIVILALCFCISLTIISACSISLEGKQMWILKSIPIKESKILTAKAIFPILLIEPIVILASILFLIVYKLTFMQFLAILTIPSLFVIITAYGGIVLNMWLPNFDWDEETKVIKQSLSVFLAMVMGLVFAVIPLVLAIYTNLGLSAVGWITAGIYLISALAFITLTYTICIKKFKRLQLS